MEQPGILLYTDISDSVSALSDAQAGRLFKAVLLFGRKEPDFSDDPVLAFAWLMLKPRLDADRERYAKKCSARSEAGRRGGLARAEAVKQNEANQAIATFATSAKQIKPKQNKTTQNKTNQNNSNSIIAPAAQTPTEETPEKPKTVRHQYGAYKNVLLSDEEFSKLVSEFPDYEARIERLSEYIASKGARYKSHLATIRAWARKDGQTARDSQRTMDADELDAIRRALEE